MNEHREWWLAIGITSVGDDICYTNDPELKCGSVHVIEKSAYDELEKKYLKLKAKEVNGTLRTYDGQLNEIDAQWNARVTGIEHKWASRVDALQSKADELAATVSTLSKEQNFQYQRANKLKAEADKLAEALENIPPPRELTVKLGSPEPLRPEQLKQLLKDYNGYLLKTYWREIVDAHISEALKEYRGKSD